MELDQNQWPLAQELFEAVLKQAPAQRQKFLNQATDDVPLRQFVERLLACHEESGTLLPESPDDALGRIFERQSPQSFEGKILGNYQIEKQIGEGGMGLVFQAHRNDEAFEKKVAVKLVRYDVSTARNKDRFQTERQMMARLEHPHIARLLDGGTADGVPYLVMEFVDGVPVTQYCDSHRLNIRQRVALFQKICGAVQLAHQNLIVHRDIKPSNILVTADGSPKLLDFGIAKLLDSQQAGQPANATVTGHRLLTPGYASPEQFLGAPVTTASDIYSLGVLLFELLSGFRPYSLENHDMEQVEAALKHRQASSLSEVLAKREPDGDGLPEIAASRGSNPSQLRRQLKGDLDHIARRALRSEPHLRYGTAAQFGEDLGRYLKGEPVWARRHTWSYWLSKFVKRNAVPVTAACVLLLSGIGFLISTRIQSIRLAQERDLAQASTRLFVESFQMADPNRAKGETITARQILENAEEKIINEHQGHPEQQAALWSAMGQVYLNLNLNDRAEPLIQRALEIQERLFGMGDPRVSSTRDSLSQLLFNQGLYQEAEEVAAATLAVRRQRKDGPREVTRSLNLLANARRAKGDRQGAIPLFEESLILQKQDPGHKPVNLVKTMNDLAYTLTLVSEFERAEPIYLEALSLQQAAVAEPFPLTSRILRGLFNLNYRWGKHEQAEPYLKAAFEMNQKLYGKEHPRIALNLHDWAKLKNRMGEPEMALSLYWESITMNERLVGPYHPGLNGPLINMAWMFHRRGALEESENLYRRALDIHMRRFEEENLNLAFLDFNLGKLLKDIGNLDEAQWRLCRAVDGFLKFAARPMSRVASVKFQLGEIWLAQGHFEAAKDALTESGSIYENREDTKGVQRVRQLLENHPDLAKIGQR